MCLNYIRCAYIRNEREAFLFTKKISMLCNLADYRMDFEKISTKENDILSYI